MRAGQTLVEQERVSSGIWFLKEGLVGLSVVAAGGQEVGCAVRGKGTVIGIESVLSLPSRYRVWTLSRALFCFAEASRLREWVGPLETPLGALLRLEIDEARRRTNDRLDLGGSATARVARVLLRRAEQEFGEAVDIPQRLLARILCMTPETLSRVLSRMKEQGAIASTHPILIADPARLRAFAEE